MRKLYISVISNDIFMSIFKKNRLRLLLNNFGITQISPDGLDLFDDLFEKWLKRRVHNQRKFYPFRKRFNRRMVESIFTIGPMKYKVVGDADGMLFVDVPIVSKSVTVVENDDINVDDLVWE